MPRAASVWPSEAVAEARGFESGHPGATIICDSGKAGEPPRLAVGRIVNKADFERLLAARARLRSAHFAIHHVAGAPLALQWRPAQVLEGELSTSSEPLLPQPVDDLPTGWWLGCVVSKRHARRAVTRNLLRRQARAAFERHVGRLPAGLWLLRLHAPFSKTDFVSASSLRLARAARAEIDALLARAGA